MIDATLVASLAEKLCEACEGETMRQQAMAHLACLGLISTTSDEAREYVAQLLRTALPMIEAGRFEVDRLQ